MYSYIKGIIADLYSDHIVIDNHGIGYEVHVSNPYNFKKGDDATVYIYQQVKEDDITLFGFKKKEEKELFQKLILVKGIGCKTAIGILATGEIDAIDLHGKFDKRAMKPLGSPDYEEATEVLIALGYKQNDVEKAMKVLSSENLDTNGYVKRALALLTQ